MLNRFLNANDLSGGFPRRGGANPGGWGRGHQPIWPNFARKLHENEDQESIPVGCIPSAAVAVSPVMHTPSAMHAPRLMHAALCHACPFTMHAPFTTHAPLCHACPPLTCMLPYTTPTSLCDTCSLRHACPLHHTRPPSSHMPPFVTHAPPGQNS